MSSTLNEVQHEARKIAWKSHVYDVFATYTDYNKKVIFTRRRALALAMPVVGSFTLLELIRKSDLLAGEYLGHDKRMLHNDADVLVKLDLMVRSPDDVDQFKANVQPMLSQNLSRRFQGG